MNLDILETIVTTVREHTFSLAPKVFVPLGNASMDVLSITVGKFTISEWNPIVCTFGGGEWSDLIILTFM